MARIAVGDRVRKTREGLRFGLVHLVVPAAGARVVRGNDREDGRADRNDESDRHGHRRIIAPPRLVQLGQATPDGSRSRVARAAPAESFRKCDSSGIRTFPARFDHNRGTTRTCIDCRGRFGRFGPVGLFRLTPPGAAAGSRIPGRRGNHVATRLAAQAARSGHGKCSKASPTRGPDKSEIESARGKPRSKASTARATAR